MSIKAVCFDCDGVLIDTISSWRIIHEHFGTNSGEMLDRFLRGEVSDAEFMADDIGLWKSLFDRSVEDTIRALAFKGRVCLKSVEGGKGELR